MAARNWNRCKREVGRAEALASEIGDLRAERLSRTNPERDEGPIKPIVAEVTAELLDYQGDDPQLREWRRQAMLPGRRITEKAAYAARKLLHPPKPVELTEKDQGLIRWAENALRSYQGNDRTVVVIRAKHLIDHKPLTIGQAELIYARAQK